MTTNSPLKKVTIRLESNQYKMLRELYPALGYNVIIRTLVENHLKAVHKKVAARMAKLSPEIPLEGIDDLLDTLVQKEDQ